MQPTHVLSGGNDKLPGTSLFATLPSPKQLRQWVLECVLKIGVVQFGPFSDQYKGGRKVVRLGECAIPRLQAGSATSFEVLPASAPELVAA